MRNPGLFMAVFLAVLGCAVARADAALLLEEPFGGFGALNPTGHAAVYLNHVCADSPTHLRLCRDGEIGVVISRYHRVDGYDWLAIPLIPYLYAVDNPEEVPATANAGLEIRLRDRYRREHLEDLVPNDPHAELPKGDWIQLVGASYDRRIWGFEVVTTQRQDEAFIRRFNGRRNISHFNLFFRNCANFAQKIMNFYYPHAIHRSFIADAGMMTPKQAAKSLVHYSHHHPRTKLRTFLIPQAPGSIQRSTPVDGVLESLVRSKKYLVPLAILHPWIAGTLAAAYLGDGRFHPNPHAQVYDPLLDWEPCEPTRAESAASRESGEPVQFSSETDANRR